MVMESSADCVHCGSYCCKFSGNLIFPEIFRKFPEILAKVWKLSGLYFSFQSTDILGSSAKNKLLFFLNIMQKVKTQRCGELFVKKHAYFLFFMVIIKKYKVKKHSLTNFRKDWNKFPEIFRGKFPEISELTTLVEAVCMQFNSEWLAVLQ